MDDAAKVEAPREALLGPKQMKVRKTKGFLQDVVRLLGLATDTSWNFQTLIGLFAEFVALAAITTLAILYTDNWKKGAEEPLSGSLVLSSLLVFTGCLLAGIALARRPVPQPTAHWTCGFRAKLRPHTLFIQMLAVQVYNIAGFYVLLVPSMFYQVLVEEDCGAMPALLLTSFGWMMLGTIAKAAMQIATASSALLWRERLTNQLQDGLRDGLTFYHLPLLRPEVDNPDQRIAQEVDIFCKGLADVLTAFSQAIFAIFWYSYQTGMITGWQGPAMIYVYALCTTILTILVAQPIPSRVAAANLAEGNFRRSHVELQIGAEQVALSGDARVEGAELGKLFAALLGARWSLVGWNGLLEVTMSFVGYAGSIVNYLVVGVALCSGLYDGVTPERKAVIISQGSGFAISVVYGFTQIVQSADSLAILIGHARRIVDLEDALNEVKQEVSARTAREVANGSRAAVGSDASVLLSCQNLSVVALSGRMLLSGINLEVRRGESLLIQGPNGCGKSSLLRVVRGIWPVTQGSVRRPQLVPEGPAGCMFLSADAYLLPSASLRQQLVYPLTGAASDLRARGSTAIPDADLEQALARTGLTQEALLLGGLDVERSDWMERLSRGQQQRLAMARLFLHRPALAFIDEAMSGIEVVAWREMHQSLMDQGTSLVTIAHGEVSEELHTKILQLTNKDA